MHRFDLILEPWIPVRALDGVRTEVGLREALVRAHELDDVADADPLVEFGLRRLLTVLLLDVFEPRDTFDLTSLLDVGSIDAVRVNDYFEQWSGRFDLFSTTHPFLQSTGTDAEPRKPLARLCARVPSDTNALHFHRRHESEFKVRPAAAARLLTTLAPFATAGGRGYAPTVTGTPPWYVWIHGASLFESLVFNTFVLPLACAPDRGVPAWRDDAPVIATERSSTTLLEALTWRPRRVRLFPAEGGVCSMTGADVPVLVGEIALGGGWSTRFEWADPAAAYRTTKKGVQPLRPKVDRQVWRDTGPLSFLRGDSSFRDDVRYQRPALLDQYAQLVVDGNLARRSLVDLTVVSLRTDMKAKVFEWQRERLRVPPELMVPGGHGVTAQQMMERAESVEYAMKSAVKLAYPRDGKGNDAAFRALAARASRAYWSALRPAFDSALLRLAALPTDEEERDEALAAFVPEWDRVIRRQAWKGFEGVVDPLDGDADAIVRQVKARTRLKVRLAKLLDIGPGPTPRTNEAKSTKGGTR